MKIYKVDKKLQYDLKHGSFSFICRDSELLGQILPDYGRTSAVLKVFFRPVGKSTAPIEQIREDLGNYVYGHYFTDDEHHDRAGNLMESLKIQNLCAFEGLAPRVYGVDLLDYNGWLFPAVVVEDLGIDTGWDVREVTKVWDKLVVVAEKYGFDVGYFDGNPTNLVANKWVDFQGFKFVDNYVDMLKSRLVDAAVWSGNHYQSVPQLGVDGFRKTDIRLKELGIDELDFEGKQILDVGCSGGQFCFYAVDHGAHYVIGVDLPEVIAGTRELGNYLGYFNIDWLGIDVTKEQIKYDADITLYLSMYMHVGLLDWVVDATRGMMVFETNGISESDIKEILQTKFKSVQTVGYASDFDGRSIIHCHK